MSSYRIGRRIPGNAHRTKGTVTHATCRGYYVSGVRDGIHSVRWCENRVEDTTLDRHARALRVMEYYERRKRTDTRHYVVSQQIAMERLKGVTR